MHLLSSFKWAHDNGDMNQIVCVCNPVSISCPISQCFGLIAAFTMC